MYFQFDATDESDTDRFGAALAQALPPGSVVALIGTLGAGKTRLVQAVAKAIGIDPRDVVSPTFVLVHEYSPRVQGSGFRVQNSGAVDSPLTTHHQPDHQTPGHQTPVSVIYHLDAYRIKTDEEFRELGPEEFFESDGWTFIEWADRVADCLPPDYLQITIDVTGLTARRFTLAAKGPSMDGTLHKLQTTLLRDSSTLNPEP